MNKLLILTICSLLFFSTLKAQPQVHTDLRTPNWALIGLRQEKQIKPLVWKVIFPAELRILNNQTIELPGYIIPTKVGNSFTQFMLSIVPIESCPFCGSGDIPSMVEVKASKAITWSDKPIRIRGKFMINDSGDGRSEFFLLNAVPL